MFLNLGADFPVYFGTVSDISDVVGKNGVDCVRVALMRLDDCFIGRSLLIAFSLHEPPEPLQGKLDMPPCCAACPSDMYADHPLRLAQEIVTENFFLCLLWQRARAAASSAWYRTAVWPQAVKRYSSSCSGSASWTNFSFIR